MRNDRPVSGLQRVVTPVRERDKAMRKLIVVGGIVGAMALTVTAGAAVVAEDGTCVQVDGLRGLWNGSAGSDDADCVTPDEYRQLYSPENLVDAGVLDAVVDNGDGTVTGVLSDSGVAVVLESDPMDRPLAATPRLEPDSPEIGDYWRERGFAVDRNRPV